jgi:hypothetical protein
MDEERRKLILEKVMMEPNTPQRMELPRRGIKIEP